MTTPINLQTIADVLKCSVKDLLTPPNALQGYSQDLSLDKILKTKYAVQAQKDIMLEVVATVEDLAQRQNKDLTVEQFLTCIREIYLHSLQMNPSKVNAEFAEWFMGLITD